MSAIDTAAKRLNKRSYDIILEDLTGEEFDNLTPQEYKQLYTGGPSRIVKEYSCDYNTSCTFSIVIGYDAKPGCSRERITGLSREKVKGWWFKCVGDRTNTDRLISNPQAKTTLDVITPTWGESPDDKPAKNNGNNGNKKGGIFSKKK